VCGVEWMNEESCEWPGEKMDRRWTRLGGGAGFDSVYLLMGEEVETNTGVARRVGCGWGVGLGMEGGSFGRSADAEPANEVQRFYQQKRDPDGGGKGERR
jgi:hypothetical protein